MCASRAPVQTGSCRAAMAAHPLRGQTPAQGPEVGATASQLRYQRPGAGGAKARGIPGGAGSAPALARGCWLLPRISSGRSWAPGSGDRGEDVNGGADGQEDHGDQGLKAPSR